MKRREQWRDVKGYEGVYMVSDQGNVKSLKRTKAAPRGAGVMQVPERILKHCKVGRKGYHSVTLAVNGETENVLIHHLVARHFVFNADPKRQVEVDFADGDINNCRADNLLWVTRQVNCRRAKRQARLERRHRKVRLRG